MANHKKIVEKFGLKFGGSTNLMVNFSIIRWQYLGEFPSALYTVSNMMDVALPERWIFFLQTAVVGFKAIFAIPTNLILTIGAVSYFSV